MALFNYANREITAKIVYYGPGVCGKTTSLQYIHERIAPSQRGRLLSLATETDRTIFFDLLPLKVGEINGFKLRFQLYTVPGQVKYNKTRKLVLQGADAVMFVADSQVNRREANIESLKNLQENLLEQNRKIEDLPLVYAFNKRDMENIMSVDDLNRDLNPKNLPHFSSIAIKGVGVMEALEAISKQARDEMYQRLTAGTSGQKESKAEAEEDLLMESDLTNLTTEGEELSFSSEELDSLQLETDLSDVAQESDLVFEDSDLETKPIGYGSDFTLEEVEIQEENVAQTGTLKESEFFDLQEIEEQALRELDEFLSDDDDDMLDFSLSDSGQGEESSPAFGIDEGFSTYDSNEGASEALSLDEEQLSGFEDESLLDFDLGEEIETSPESNLETEAGSDLSFSLDDATDEESLAFDLASSGDDLENAGTEFEESSLSALTIDDDEMLAFNLDDETQGQENALKEPPTKEEIESLDFSDSALDMSFDDHDPESFDLSDNDLDMSFDDQVPEEDSEELSSFSLDENDDTQGESTPLTLDEDDLIAFSLDDGEGSQESSKGAIEPLDLSEGDLDMTFGDDAGSELERSQENEFESSESEEEEDFPDFRITDSVKFEMQHGEELSSITSFEKQLDELSEDVFTGEEELAIPDEFEPELSETSEEEEFQDISDEWTRLLVLAKHLYHNAETLRAQHTTGGNIQSIFMYYAALETAVKAVASKYDSCNPKIASFHLMLESIEEETEKTVTGVRSIKDNVVNIMNTLQLESGYPDDEECELAARISERFLSSLAQEFLTIDFSKLASVLPRPKT